jgi:hypothetical protein
MSLLNYKKLLMSHPNNKNTLNKKKDYIFLKKCYEPQKTFAYSENKTKQEAKKEKVPLPGIEPGSPG